MGIPQGHNINFPLRCLIRITFDLLAARFGKQTTENRPPPMCRAHRGLLQSVALVCLSAGSPRLAPTRRQGRSSLASE